MAKNPEIYVLLVDETEYWRKDIVEAAGRLIGVYLYDASYTVHICSLQSSAECYFVETVTSNDISDELYQEIWVGNNDTTVEYFSQSDVDRASLVEQSKPLPDGVKMAKFHHWTPDAEELEFLRDNNEDVRAAAMEAALEYARCNSVY